MKKSKVKKMIDIPFLQVGTDLYTFSMKKSKEAKDIKTTPIVIDTDSKNFEIDKVEIIKLLNLIGITKDKC